MSHSKVEEAIILSAGEGLRLWPITEELPKCLVKVKDKPILEYQIERLKRFGIKKFIVTVRKDHQYISKVEVARLSNKLDVDIGISVEGTILGTAGGTKKAMKYIDGNTFMVINGDDIADVDVAEFLMLEPPAIVVSRPRSQFGVVRVEKGKVISFGEKAKLDILVNMGWYHLDKEIKDMLPDIGSLEYEVFPKLTGRLRAYIHEGMWVTVNSIKDIQSAEEVL